jgi:Zn-dependent protease with chaperone function
VLGAVAAAAMLLNTGIITLIVALASRSVVAAIAGPAVIAIAVIMTTVVIRQAQNRAVYLDAGAAGPYLDRVEPVVVRVAVALDVAVPAVRIIDDPALNALSATGTIAYTKGLLDAIEDEDEEMAAVTAHLLGRQDCGDNGLAVFSYGVLAWALEPFDVVVMRLVRLLRRMGKGCVNFAFGRDTGSGGDEASFYFRLLLFVFALALGLELLAAALALFLLGGALALTGVLTLRALAWQRMRFADEVAASVAGSVPARAALSMLDDLPTELGQGGVTLQDLCFAGPRPMPGYVPYTPDLGRRIAWLESGADSRSTGLLAPLASAVALVAVLGGLALATAKVPYGVPFGHGGGGGSGGTVPVADTGGTASGAALGRPPPQQSGSAPAGSAPAPSGTRSGPGLASGPPVTGSPSPSSSPSPSPVQDPSPSGPPAAPSGVTATPNGQYAITVTWVTNASDATGFNIDNGCPPGSCQPGATLTQTTGVTTTASFTVTPGSYQCFRVQAFNSAGSSAWSSYGCTQTPGFTAQGTQSWTDTGVTVPAGIVLKITASGTVYVTSSYSVSPAGTQSCIPSTNYPGENPPFLAANLPCWSLIGRIGSGTPFEIGTSATITTTAGPLYLSANDNSFADNSGSWLVDIKEGG